MNKTTSPINNIEFRRANILDIFHIYKWRNDPESVKYSKTKSKVRLFEHTFWYFKKLNSKEDILIIFFQNKVRFSFIKLSKIKNFNLFEISINMNPKFRGKKLSLLTLSSAEKFILKQIGNCTIIAYINLDNQKSLKLFQKLGYTKTNKNSDNFLIFSKKLLEKVDN